MKILLINPSKYDKGARVEKYRLGTLAPLNLTIIAGLVQNKGIKVRIVDEYLEDIPFLESFDLVGITTTFTCTFPRVIDISNRFRERGIPVVLGGTHATCSPEEAIRYADSIVLGEAEGSFQKLVEDLSTTGAIQKFYKNEKFIDLEKEPFRKPDYGLVDLSKYIRLGFFFKRNLFAIESSRGCPMACTFCCVGFTHGKKTRFKSISSVVEEIRYLKSNYGAKFFTFADDNFAGNSDRCRGLLAEIGREDIRFFCELSTRIIEEPQLIETLSKSGCVSALIGLESINSQNLDAVSKGFNKPNEYKKLFSLFRKNRIAAMASMIFGFDYDTRETFSETVNFLKKCDVPRTLLSILTPVPGTRLYEELSREGRIFEKNLSIYDGAHAVFVPKGMTVQELENGFWRAYRDFYSLSSIGDRIIHSTKHEFLYTAFSNLRFRKLVYQGLYPYNSGIGRLP